MLWSNEDYMMLLLGSFQGKSRMELAEVLERNTAKIFSKIQKHLDLISKVETTLTKIKRK